MFSGEPGAAANAARIATYFNNATFHMSHGRRIGRDEARTQGLKVEDLEADQTFQDHVLTAYHLITIMFEKGPATKVLTGDSGTKWVKNLQIQMPAPPHTRP